MKHIYFDNNATTPLNKDVIAAMTDIAGSPLNPSSVHSFGRKARSIVEAARTNILKTLNASNKRLVFTASGTEANNLAMKGLPDYKKVISAIEHPSVTKAAAGNIRIVKANKNGLVNINDFEEILASDRSKAIVSVMLANNETGVIQPVKEIAAIAKKYGAILHSDITQALGKIRVDISDLGVDMVTISAHKFGGPQGAAALIIDKSIQLDAQVLGGGQEQNLRAGTENVLAIHGFGVAINMINTDMAEIEALRNYIDNRIIEICPDAIIFGKNIARLPNTSFIAMPRVSSETQLIEFDLNNIAVSSGSACSSGKVEVSKVLTAMGYDNEIASTAIRLSLGHGNTKEEAERFIKIWTDLYERVKGERK